MTDIFGEVYLFNRNNLNLKLNIKVEINIKFDIILVKNKISMDTYL